MSRAYLPVLFQITNCVEKIWHTPPSDITINNVYSERKSYFLNRRHGQTIMRCICGTAVVTLIPTVTSGYFSGKVCYK